MELTPLAGRRRGVPTLPEGDGDPNAPLSVQEERFCEEFLIDLNAAGAARRAGYAEDNARSIGARLLARIHVQTRLQRLMDDRSARTGLTADRVLQELGAIALSDIRTIVRWGSAVRVIDEDGNHVVAAGVAFRDSIELNGIEAAAVKSIEQKADGGVKLVLHDKPRAIELIMRHLGMLKPDAPSDVNVNLIQNALMVIGSTADGLEAARAYDKLVNAAPMIAPPRAEEAEAE